MLKYRNFGKQSLKEIGEILNGMGLHLGMDVDAVLGGMAEKKTEQQPAKEEEKTEMPEDATTEAEAL